MSTPPRTVADILTVARNADCPRCASDPLEACWPEWHLERVIRAWMYGWVPDTDLIAVMEALVTFQLETAFRHVPAVTGRVA